MWTKEKRAEYMREYRAKHRDWIKVTERLWREKYREDINRRARHRYATDAAYRARILAAQHAKRMARRQTDDGA